MALALVLAGVGGILARVGLRRPLAQDMVAPLLLASSAVLLLWAPRAWLAGRPEVTAPKPPVSVRGELGAAALLVALVPAGEAAFFYAVVSSSGLPLAVYFGILVPVGGMLCIMASAFRTSRSQDRARASRTAPAASPYRGAALQHAVPARRRGRAVCFTLTGVVLMVSGSRLWWVAYMPERPQGYSPPAWVGVVVALLVLAGAVLLLSWWPRVATGEGAPVEIAVGRPSTDRKVGVALLLLVGAILVAAAWYGESAAPAAPGQRFDDVIREAVPFLCVPLFLFGALAMRMAFVVLHWKRPEES
jgi:hypothetical protein